MDFLKCIYYFFWSILFPPKEKDIDKTKFGLNSFLNIPLFGSPEEQLGMIEDLNVPIIRLLFNWNDDIQPERDGECNWSFYDDIVYSLPENVRAIAVLNGVPSWFEKGDNVGYFMEYCHKVMTRYSEEDKLIGYQIGNEPNSDMFIDNVKMQLIEHPENYIRLLYPIYDMSRKINKNKLIISAATTSIVQNYPDTMKYNKMLIELNIHKFCDVYAIHYYADSWRGYFNLLRPGRVLELIKKIRRPICITEIGTGEFNEHKKFARTRIPFLFKKIKNLRYVFWYKFTGQERKFELKSINQENSKLLDYLESIT